MRKSKAPSPQQRPTYGLRPLAEVVGQIAQPLLGKQGHTAALLFRYWPAIVGEGLARLSQPAAIRHAPRGAAGATLQIRVFSGAAALEIQHLSNQILTRINDHLGEGSIARLKLIQAPKPPQPALPVRPIHQPVDPAVLEAALAPMPEGRLRTALAGLGAAVFAEIGPVATGEAALNATGTAPGKLVVIR